MFEFIQKLYQDDALTLAQLETRVLNYNATSMKLERIKPVDLSKGGYVSIRKYKSKCNKYDALKVELQRREQTCGEMHMRISILEQRLKAYELMMIKQSEDTPSNFHV